MISQFADLPESLIFKAPVGIKILLSLTDISCLVVKNDRARVVELVDTQDLGSCIFTGSYFHSKDIYIISGMS